VYIPAFARYSAAVTRALARLEAARSIIEAAAILPAQEDVLRRDAKVGSVHYSNVIEGNELPLIEAARAVEHDLAPDTKAKLELVNYVAALDFIDSRAGEISYTPAFLKELHGVLTKGLGRPDARFKPQHEGDWRDGYVAVGDAMTVFHVAPGTSYNEVDALMTERLEWLETKRLSSEYLPPIIAAVAHFEVAEVHPFADYNGRCARLFAHAVLVREDYDNRRLFSPERYYAEDRDAYYAALRAIKRTRNLNDWLSYFTEGLAAEFERAAELVRRVNVQTQVLPLPIRLTRPQEVVVAELTAGQRQSLTRTDVERLTGLRKAAAAEALKSLVEIGVLRRVGSGPRQQYELAARPRSRPLGRRPVWTEERIREELVSLAEALGRWPAVEDFEQAGKSTLYKAASRQGGMRRWRREIESHLAWTSAPASQPPAETSP
jgi:Fic family protein